MPKVKLASNEVLGSQTSKKQFTDRVQSSPLNASIPVTDASGLEAANAAQGASITETAKRLNTFNGPWANVKATGFDGTGSPTEDK